MADPSDKRSKKLVLTDSGIALIKQAAGFMVEVDETLAGEVGTDLFADLHRLSRRLFHCLNLKYPDAGQYTPHRNRRLPLIVYATSISNALDFQLKQINSDKGHPPLKRSYWHILEKIARKGTRINDLAAMNGISKQAISQLAAEIEKAGYIERMDDPADRRSKQLVPTAGGMRLIGHTLDSTRRIEAQVEQLLGQEDFNTLKQSLWQYLQLAEYRHNEQPPLEAQIHKAIADVIGQYPANYQHPWLVQDHGGVRLSNAALAALQNQLF